MVFGSTDVEPSANPLESLGHNPGYNAFDALTAIDPISAAVRPRLATSWKRIDDNTMEFKLRPNVKFSDGAAFTADDAKFTIDVTLSESLAVSSLINTIKEATVVDPLTLRVVTSSPDPILEKRLALLFLVPKAHYMKVGTKAFSQSPVGTGKYMISSFTPGQSIQLDANPNSWSGQPATPHVTLQFFQNENTLQAAMEASQVDIGLFKTQSQTLDQLANQFNVKSVNVGSPQLLKLDTTKAPFNNQSVRQAMNYAIDTATVVKTVLKGLATPLDGQLPGPNCFGYNPNLKPFSYDPQKAKQLLAAAGYSNGFTVRIASQYQPPIEAVSGYLKNIGVTAQVVVEDRATYLKEFYAGSQYEMYMIGFNYSPINDADLSFRWPTYPPPGTAGRREWVDSTWDSMLAQERSTLDSKKRLAVLQQMGSYLRDQSPETLLWGMQYAYAWSKKVAGFNTDTGYYILFDSAYKTA